MDFPFGAMGKLLVLTVQRRGEVASLRWGQLDLDAKRGKASAAVWRLESADTKAARAHQVPLNPQAVALLRQLPRIDGEDRVFPAERPGSANSVSGFSRALKRAIELSGVKGWT